MRNNMSLNGSTKNILNKQQYLDVIRELLKLSSNSILLDVEKTQEIIHWYVYDELTIYGVLAKNLSHPNKSCRIL